MRKSFEDIYVNKLYGNATECTNCNGSGVVQYEDECPTCKGEGFTITDEE